MIQPQTNASKVTLLEVQQIRAMANAGFTTKSIGSAFKLCAREISNIIKGITWYWLPVEVVPLPILPPGTASVLKLRKVKTLSLEESIRIERYRHELARHIDNQAAREGYAIGLLTEWTLRRKHEDETQINQFERPAAAAQVENHVVGN